MRSSHVEMPLRGSAWRCFSRRERAPQSMSVIHSCQGRQGGPPGGAPDEAAIPCSLVRKKRWGTASLYIYLPKFSAFHSRVFRERFASFWSFYSRGLKVAFSALIQSAVFESSQSSVVHSRYSRSISRGPAYNRLTYAGIRSVHCQCG